LLNWGTSALLVNTSFPLGIGPRVAIGPIGDAAAKVGAGTNSGSGDQLGTIVVVLVAICLAFFGLTRIFAILSDIVKRDWAKFRDDITELFQVFGCFGLLAAVVFAYSRFI
jgi:hypothetical protein